MAYTGPLVPKHPAHIAAMNAHAGLSQTQFGRAALERHGHEPMSVEAAQAYQKQAMPAQTAVPVAQSPGQING